MPVIIAPESYETWLAGEPDQALRLIRPAPDDYLIAEETRIERAASARPAPVASSQDRLL
jgi:putative SOS response-associated peptidase YedK